MANNNETTTKFKVDISELKKSMQQARKEVALANSEFKATSSSMDDWGKSTDGISAKLKQLDSNLASQKNVLSEYEKTLAAVKAEYGENSKEAMEYQTKLNNQQAIVNNTEKQIRQYSEALERAKEAERIAADSGRDASEVFDELGRVAQEASDEVGGASEGFTIMKGALADLVAGGIRATIDTLKDLVTDSSNAYAQFSASTGIATSAMGEYEDAIKSVYKNNFGESLEDVANKMARVKEVTGELDASKLQDMTEKAITLEDTFGMDMTETLRGVQSLMDHFGMTSEEAFDYISSGAQNGLNYTDELGDNLSEYAGKFAEAGYSADEYFQLLQNGSDGGAYNLDKVNDAINEVTARLADDTIGDSIGSFSNDTQDLFKAWQNGEATQKQVIDSIVKDIQGTTNEQEKMNLAALAFGTMAEDGGTKFIESLTSVGNTYDDVQGKADELVKTKYDTPMAAIQGIGRTIKVDLLQPLVDNLMPTINKIADWVESNLPSFIEKVKDISDKVKALSPLIAGVGTALAGLALAGLIQNIGAVGAAIKTAMMSTKLMTAAQWLLNAAMSANVFSLIVIGIAALVAAFVVLWNKSEGFRNFWLGLWDGISSAFDTAMSGIVKFFTEIIPNVFNSVIEWIKANWVSILLFLINPFAGLFKYFYDNNSKFKEFVDNAIKHIKELPSKIWEWLKKTIEKVSKWKTDMTTKAKEAATNFINNVVNFIKELPSKMWTWLQNTISKVTNFASNLKTKGTEAAKNLFDSVTNGIKSLPDKIKETGTNIVKGLWNGINDMAGWIKGKIEGFGKGVLNNLKDFFGIKSPSRVMRDQVGKNLALGVAEGIEKNEKYAKQSAEEMGKTILTESKKTLNKYKANHSLSLAEEVKYWDSIRKTIKNGTQARSDADAKYLSAKKSLNDKLTSLDKKYKSDSEKIYTDLTKSVTDLNKKYEDAVNSRANTITSSLNLFKKFEASEVTNKNDLSNNLKSQVNALKEWDNTLTKLSKRKGMDSNLLSELEGMGVDSLDTLKELNSMSDKELASYVSLYKQKNKIANERATKENEALKKQTESEIKKLKEQAKTKLSSLKDTYDKELNSLGVDTEKHSESIGSDIIKGISKGIKSSKSSLNKTIKNLASSIVKDAKKALEIKSPSRLLANEVGKFIPAGIALGIDKNSKTVLSSMKKLTTNTVSAARNGLYDVSGSLSTGSNGTGGVVNNFYQTNNSPKALSRLEIYRQSKNLLGYAGGV